MENYDVFVTPIADVDIQSIVNYLSGFSINIAVRHYDALVDGIKSLKTMPERCPLVSSEALRQKGYRWLSVRNYIVFFCIDDARKVVRINRVLHSLQEYDVLL